MRVGLRKDFGDPRAMEMSVLAFFYLAGSIAARVSYELYIKQHMDMWCCWWGLQYCAYRRFPKGPNIEVRTQISNDAY